MTGVFIQGHAVMRQRIIYPVVGFHGAVPLAAAMAAAAALDATEMARAAAEDAIAIRPAAAAAAT